MSRRRAAADIVPHGFVLAWLHLKARPDGERLRESRAHLDPRDLFTADVLQRLAAIKESLGPAFQGLTQESTAASWQEACSTMHARTIGLMLLRSTFSPGTEALLTEQARISHDWWQRTKFRCEPLVYFDIVDVALFEAPVAIYTEQTLHLSRGWFFNATQ